MPLVRLLGERRKLRSSDGILAKERVCVCLRTCTKVVRYTYPHTGTQITINEKVCEVEL